MTKIFGNARGAALSAIALAYAAASHTQAAIVQYSTSFESPTFTTTGGYQGLGRLYQQDSWVTVGITPYVVSDASGLARTGNQCVVADTTAALFNSGEKWAVQYLNPVTNAAETGVGIVSISAWVNIYSKEAGSTVVAQAGIDSGYDNNGRRLGNLSIGSDGLIRMKNQAGTMVTAALAGFGLNQWYRLEMRFDYSTKRTTYLVNGNAIDTSSSSGFANFTATTIASGSLFSSRVPPSVGVASGSYRLLFDDYSLSLVPTPGAIALMGIAGIAGRRRRA